MHQCIKYSILRPFNIRFAAPFLEKHVVKFDAEKQLQRGSRPGITHWSLITPEYSGPPASERWKQAFTDQKAAHYDLGTSHYPAFQSLADHHKRSLAFMKACAGS